MSGVLASGTRVAPCSALSVIGASPGDGLAIDVPGGFADEFAQRITRAEPRFFHEPVPWQVPRVLCVAGCRNGVGTASVSKSLLNHLAPCAGYDERGVRAGASNCSVRQGALNSDRSEGTWHGAFPTYEEARRTAAVFSPQKGAQLNCRLCHPQLLK